MAHKTFQERKLLGGKRDRLIGTGDSASQRIEHQIADLETQIHFRAVASAEGSNSSEQLGECKRFGQIVVGAAVQSADLHFYGIAGGQQQNRRRNPVLSQLATDIETVHERQRDIQQYQ